MGFWSNVWGGVKTLGSKIGSAVQALPALAQKGLHAVNTVGTKLSKFAHQGWVRKVAERIASSGVPIASQIAGRFDEGLKLGDKLLGYTQEAEKDIAIARGVPSVEKAKPDQASQVGASAPPVAPVSRTAPQGATLAKQAPQPSAQSALTRFRL